MVLSNACVRDDGKEGNEMAPESCVWIHCHVTSFADDHEFVCCKTLFTSSAFSLVTLFEGHTHGMASSRLSSLIPSLFTVRSNRSNR